jgi:hypothetical protein
MLIFPLLSGEGSGEVNGEVSRDRISSAAAEKITGYICHRDAGSVTGIVIAGGR